jgi:nucleotide-binding universal stress UspA family protein
MADRSAGQAVVIVAYDGSPAARQAIVDSGKILGPSRMLVATVWEEGLAYAGPVMPSDGITVTPMVDPGTAFEVDRAVQNRAERVAREGAELARSLGLEAEPLAVTDEGDVAESILRLARDRNAAAIVVGSRGLSGIRARLEGSTSRALLKHASCPVIVVHEADEESDQAR